MEQKLQHQRAGPQKGLATTWHMCNSDGNGCRVGQSGGQGQPCGTDGNWRCQPKLGLVKAESLAVEVALAPSVQSQVI